MIRSQSHGILGCPRWCKLELREATKNFFAVDSRGSRWRFSWKFWPTFCAATAMWSSARTTCAIIGGGGCLAQRTLTMTRKRFWQRRWTYGGPRSGAKDRRWTLVAPLAMDTFDDNSTFSAKKRSSMEMKNKMVFWQTLPLETSRNPKFRGHVRLSPLSYPTCHTAFNPPCTGYCWCRHNEYETHCGILANNRPGNFPQIQNFGAISAHRPHHTLCLIPLLILQVTGEP